jgi:SagB-type dehydrogenase family enzyme
LPLLAAPLPIAWDALFAPNGVPPRALTLESIGHLFEFSLGISAWKSYDGARWALRCNPSSGNLHPTEGYLICPPLPGLAAGVHHYRPDIHALEHRAAAPCDWRDGVLLALTGIHWREAWKYGMRAFRYCQHDAGHALAAISYAAAVLGWRAQRLDDWGDDALAALTGADRSGEFPAGDGETPEALVWIGAGPPPSAAQVLDTLATAAWSGAANRLSPTHRDWPDIAAVAVACHQPSSQTPVVAPTSTPPPPLAPTGAIDATTLIRRRRSAQAFDGVTAMSGAHFFRLLDALLPRPSIPPWSLLTTPAAVHPVLFVHRVTDLAPGIYCLPRTPEALPDLRAAMRPDWLWERVAVAPPHLPLYLLAPLAVGEFAATASCHQEIGADAAFMLAMLARFDDIAAAPWRYRQRFVEAGMLGQVLYLEAEAGKLQGTGIGCYFDDVVHRALGLDTARFQDVYQFTVGAALTDARIGNEPGYAALARARGISAP